MTSPKHTPPDGMLKARVKRLEVDVSEIRDRQGRAEVQMLHLQLEQRRDSASIKRKLDQLLGLLQPKVTL